MISAIADRIFRRHRERVELKNDYQAVFGTPAGKRVLADILARGGVTRPRFDAEPNVIAFYEGHRHLAMSIFRQVHSSNDVLPELIHEQIQRQEELQKEQNT